MDISSMEIILYSGNGLNLSSVYNLKYLSNVGDRDDRNFDRKNSCTQDVRTALLPRPASRRHDKRKAKTTRPPLPPTGIGISLRLLAVAQETSKAADL